MLMVRDGGVQRAARSAIGVGLALVAVFGAPAGASAQSVGDGLVPVVQSPAQIHDYWTPERMRDAIPIGGPLGAATALDAKRRGTSAKPVKHVRRFPLRTHGKAFLTLGGVDYVCSATSVGAPSHSLVWTAGHCVYEPGVGGGFASNFEFVPAYRDGNAPFGEWASTGLQSTSQWKNSGSGICIPPITSCGDVRFDLGAVTVEHKSGNSLEGRVGGRGIAFNYDPSQVYRPFGYPAEPPFNGQRMYRCKSGLAGRDNNENKPKPMKIVCDMTAGSSGGGWVTKGGKVASVISYGYAGDANHLYGPYQGNAAQGLYNQVKDG